MKNRYLKLSTNINSSNYMDFLKNLYKKTSGSMPITIFVHDIFYPGYNMLAKWTYSQGIFNIDKRSIEDLMGLSTNTLFDFILNRRGIYIEILDGNKKDKSTNDKLIVQEFVRYNTDTMNSMIYRHMLIKNAIDAFKETLDEPSKVDVTSMITFTAKKEG